MPKPFEKPTFQSREKELEALSQQIENLEKALEHVLATEFNYYLPPLTVRDIEEGIGHMKRERDLLQKEVKPNE